MKACEVKGRNILQDFDFTSELGVGLAHRGAGLSPPRRYFY